MKNIQYVWILILSMALFAFNCSNAKIAQNQEETTEVEEELEEDYYDDEEDDYDYEEEEADTVSYDDWEIEEETDTTNIQ